MWTEPGMWPAAYSSLVAHVDDDEAVAGGEALRQRVGVDQLEAVHGSLLRAPRCHPARKEPPDDEPYRREELGGLELVAVGGGDDDQLDVAGHDPARPWSRTRCRRRRR